MGKENEYPLVIYQDLVTNPILKPIRVAIRKYALEKIRSVVKVPEENFDRIFVKYQRRMRYASQDKLRTTPNNMFGPAAKPSMRNNY